MMLSLAQAAEACHVNRSTILRAIKAGKLSGSRDAHGQWTIDAAEVTRLYPPERALGVAQVRDEAAAGRRTDEIEQQLGHLRTALEDMRGERDHWRADAQAWKEQAQSATRLLTDQREQPGQGVSEKPIGGRTWWRWRKAG
jgi:hypothetical protein